MLWKHHLRGDHENCAQKPEFCPTQQFTCISKSLHLIHPLHIWACLLVHSFFVLIHNDTAGNQDAKRKEGNTI